MYGNLGAWFHARLNSQVSLVNSPFSSLPWLLHLRKAVLLLTRVVKRLAFYIPLTAIVITHSSVVYGLFPFQNLLEGNPQYVPGSSAMVVWN